jgi:hypothetical protein
MTQTQEIIPGAKRTQAKTSSINILAFTSTGGLPVMRATQEAETGRINGSKPAQANRFKRSYLKKLITKKGLVEWHKV